MTPKELKKIVLENHGYSEADGYSEYMEVAGEDIEYYLDYDSERPKKWVFKINAIHCGPFQTWIDEDKCFNSTDEIEKYIVGLIKKKIKEWTKFVKDYKLSHTKTKKENECI